MPAPRLFAVMPAAGLSRRMGEPKLLLPLAGRTVIARVLEALDRPAIADRLLVARPDDAPLHIEARRCGARVIIPDVPPPDMRTSVEHALDAIRRHHAPAPHDGWLLLPADHPVLDRPLIDDLIAHWLRENHEILIPTHAGRRGHPALFHWPLAQEVPRIPHDQGLNWLVRSRPERVAELPVNNPDVLTDLDTPDEYRRLQSRFA